MAPTGLLESFLGAIQASLSVLLVIFYGVIAARLNLLNTSSTKAISKVCVRLFLPALLITQIGSELHAGSAGQYLIIFLWAIVCHLLSFVIGAAAHTAFGLPDWVTAALMFNNTTSYPLLLVTALDETGILQVLYRSGETSKGAIARANSYFLVFATVSSCLTFAVGPRLIDSEHGPDHGEEDKDGIEEEQQERVEYEAVPDREALSDRSDERMTLLDPRPDVQFADPFGGANCFLTYNRKPSDSRPRVRPDRRASIIPKTRWARLGPRAKWWFLFISDFFNAPLLGALVGVFIGLIPALHKAFFNDSQNGGIFTAWLTASLKSIGSLFVPLPVVTAGVSLYTSMRESRRSGSSAPKLPVGATAFILIMRFLVWPALSISFLWLLASRTEILGLDPMLWFTMMLMPTGPTAMKLITLVEVSDLGEREELNIAKLLTISYVISPVLSFTVVGSLMASQASMR